MKILYFFLLLSLSALALTPEEKAVLKRVDSYYKLVGMKDQANWLSAQAAADKIQFGELEPDVDANCDIETGNITINSLKVDSTFRTLVNFGNALQHERVHQNQSPEGWKNELWREKYWLGNSYERQAWARGLVAARAATFALQRRLINAAPGRERGVAAGRLKDALDDWNQLTDGWREERKKAGNFGRDELVTEDGLPISLEEMEKERTAVAKVISGAKITSEGLTRSYAGSYSGPIEGGAQGTAIVIVGANHGVTGRLSGRYKKGTYIASITSGEVTLDGLFRGSIAGEVETQLGTFKFTGTISGSFSGSQGSGQWSAGSGSTWPSGSWRVTR